MGGEKQITCNNMVERNIARLEFTTCNVQGMVKNCVKRI